MPTSKADGSQTAVIDTEHTLATITDAGSYVFEVDSINMVLGDELTLRVYKKVRSTGTTRLAYIVNYDDAQSTPVILSIPVASVHEFVVSLEQTAGTGRTYNWEITEL